MTVLDTNLVSVMINPRDAERYPKTLALVESLLKTDGLSISAVTLFELRRGLEKLRLSGSGRSKLVKFEKLLEYVEVLGLDGSDGGAWSVAARIWARASMEKPAINFLDADLLVAATAIFHGRPFATAEKGLVAALHQLGFASSAQLIALE